jgi:hypothetical protein
MAGLSGCGAGSGRAWATKFSKPAEGLQLRPGPPEDVYWIRALAAKLPAKTAGGQSWDDDGGLPDAYVLIRDGKREVLRGLVCSEQLTPSWPKQKGSNIYIRPASELKIAVMDDDAIDDAIVCEGMLPPPTVEQLEAGEMMVRFQRGAWLRLEISKAHALYGLGLDYAITQDVLQVTRVLKHSPAGREGLKAGDRIVQLAGKDPMELGWVRIKTALRTIPIDGLSLIARSGKEDRSMVLKEGPVYPLHAEYGSFA